MPYYKNYFKDFLDEQLTDARFYQIVYLSIFFIYGVHTLHWDFNLLIVGAIIVTAITTQILSCFVFHKSFDAIKSATITALGLSILLKTQYWQVAVLAAFIAIISKYLLRINGKHIFNPANVGLVLTIYLTKMAWVSPGQWGSSLVLLYFIFAAGSILLLKVGRMDTGLVFFFTYAFCQFAYSSAYLGWPLDFTIHKLSNGALVFYSFFMITDSSTTPNHPKARVAWSICIALLAFYFSEFKYMNGAPVKALFLISMATPLLDYAFKSIRFSWKHSLKF
ncbi:MAG: RnfABCDGE type electron transport complex subunit D [bacterium]|nr:RnfABCDGE type electron transport complex subunit D [bacterium]